MARLLSNRRLIRLFQRPLHRRGLATALNTAAIANGNVAFSVPSNGLLLDNPRSPRSRYSYRNSEMIVSTTERDLGGNNINNKDRPMSLLRSRFPAVVARTLPRGESFTFLTHSARCSRLKKLLQGHGDKMLLRVISQLVPAEGLDCTWAGTILTLAMRGAAEQKRPALEEGDSLDIRDHIKVKLLPGGRPSDSLYIDGIVFKKNVAHRRMKDNFDDPRILLLGCSIEFQRIANTLSVFDQLLESERIYLAQVVERICAIKPTVVLVEGTVSRVALEMFLGSGITLVVNVKRTVLRRVARVTNADIVPSTEHGALENPKLGKCGNFRVRHFADSTSAVTQPVVLISGCNSSVGGTCILRGGSQQLLEPVKKILTFAILVAYHLRLEMRLLEHFNMAPKTLGKSSTSLLPSLDQQHRSSLTTEVALRFYETLKKYHATLANIENAATDNPSSPSSSSSTEKTMQQQQKQTIHLTYSPDVDFSSCPSPNKNKLTICIPSNFVQPSYDSPTVWPRATINPDNLIVDTERVVVPVDFARLFQVKEDLGKDERNSTDLAQRLRMVSNEAAPLLQQPSYYKELTAIYGYQQLAYTYAIYCRGDHHPKANCIPFDLHLVDFYSETDLPLGLYFRRHLFDEETRCLDKDCNRRLIEHDRSFMHNTTRLDLSVHTFTGERPLKFDRDDILTSSLCQVCAAQSPLQPLRPDALQCSFGKFLELVFYNQSLHPFQSEHRCKHTSHSHTRYFVYRDWIAQMTFKPVTLFSIHEPPLQIAPPLAKRRQVMQAEVESLKTACQELSTLMQARITALPTNTNADSDAPYHEAKEKLVGDYRRACQTMRETLEKLDVDALAENPCLLNTSKRQVYLATVTWVAALQEVQHASHSSTKKLTREGSLRRSLSTASNGRGDRSESTLTSTFAHTNPPDTTPSSSFDQQPLSTTPVVIPIPLVGELPTPPPTPPPLLTPTPLSRSATPSPQLPERFDPDANYYNNNNNNPNNNNNNPTEVVAISCTPTPTAELSSPAATPKLSESKVPDTPKPADAEAIPSTSSANLAKDKIPRSFAALFDNFRVRASPHLLAFMVEGQGLLLPDGASDMQVCVHKNELGSVLAYALNSTEYATKFVQKFGYAHDGPPQVQQTYNKVSPECSVLFSVGLGSHQHIETRMAHEVTGVSFKLKVVSYFAEGFQALRRLTCGGDFQFLSSLARCQTWQARGGKSNSSWERTLDGRYVIKQISRAEIVSFLQFGPRYFHYMGDVFSDGIPTMLAKCLGVFSISYTIGRKNVGVITVLVMENLFCGRQISKVYDLKGSLRSRYVKQSTEPSKVNSEVWLDENLLEWMFDDPILVDESAKAKLMTSIFNDTLFLARQDVMDYSLLVGIDEQSKELVVGIIDYFRTFTLDKAIEMWIKKTGMLGKGNVPPTVILPEQYMIRFREQLWLYFVLVPHKFTSFELLPTNYGMNHS